MAAPVHVSARARLPGPPWQNSSSEAPLRALLRSDVAGIYLTAVARAGLGQLRGAEEHQRDATSAKCIAALMVLIVLLIGALAVKHRA